jgi:hypothetical protein
MYSFARSGRRKLEGLPLQPKRHAKAGRGWLAAASILGLICIGFSPMRGFAQATSSTTAPSNQTGEAKTPKTAKTTASKTHAKATGSASKASSSSSAKAHPASHSSPDKHPKSGTTVTAHNSKTKHASSRKKKTTARGQQKIEPERAQAIQEALIREHYMGGEATGTWNQSSEDAMRRYQADHGWQSKTVPDSRALISLGLGPSHDHLLNPESAMTTGPFPPRAASLTPASHSADPGSRLNTNSTPSTEPAPTAIPDHDKSAPQ